MEHSVAVDYLKRRPDSPLVQESPNGRYRVAATTTGIDSDDSGRVALARNDQILWEAELPRPTNPSVSNEGTVAVENWGPPDSRELESDFCVIDERGKVLIKRHYEADSLASGISEDGKLAWYTTAHADSGDGNKVFVYKLEGEEQVLKAELPLRGVENVEMDGGIVRLNIEGIECEYRDGKLVNPEVVCWKKEKRRLENPESPMDIANVVKKRLERADQLSDEQLRDTLSKAKTRSRGLSGSTRVRAKLYRRRGELHQYFGQKERALECYEKALSLDEDVGVKRKTRRLREEVGEEDNRE